MLALWILGGILIFLVILLNCPVRAELRYWDSVFTIKVKYLFWTLYPLSLKEKPKTKKKDTSDSGDLAEAKDTHSKPRKTARKKYKDKKISDSASQEENVSESPPPKSGFDEVLNKIRLVKELLESSKKGLRRIIKGITIADIWVDFAVAHEDACKAALLYGGLNTLTYNVISFLRVFFTISIEKIDISCRYNSSDSYYNGQCKVNLRPATALLAAISILFRYFVHTYKMKKQAIKMKGMDSDGTSDSRTHEHSNGENP